MMTDPISDMLTRIRNAIAVHKSAINLPHSKLKQSVAEILQAQGYIAAVKVDDVAGFKRLFLTLHEPGASPSINHVKRISKPGRRLYSNASDLPRALGGRGIVIVSTSRGLMTDSQARQARIGGELICEVY